MELRPLPVRAALEDYRVQAAALLAALPTEADAELALARWYDLRDWAALVAHVTEVARPDSAVARFESAVEAVVDGDERALAALLAADPELVRARSTRVTTFDPPVHRATLLHYVAANGVERFRQRSPKNAPAIARMLLVAGAAPDAVADMYGQPCTTMGMLVSSDHPAAAGVQVALVGVLVDHGASVQGPDGVSRSPLTTALAFGFGDAAAALAMCGAPAADLASVAGLGRADDAARLLPDADATERHRALALAAQHGHVAIVRLLLDAGEDPDRYNPPGFHPHSTPLHQAVAAGREDVVHLLVERGARLDVEDKVYRGTAAGWAAHCGRKEIETYLRARLAGRGP